MINISIWLLLACAILNGIVILVFLTRSKNILNGLGKSIREEMQAGRQEANQNARDLRQEVTSTLTSLGSTQQEQLSGLQTTIDSRLKELQESNEKKLEKMRETVDEKLQKTLESRLGESFSLVSKRLEEVHRGLGEVQGLASGVGDLKRVLTNVKARGTWAEIQLGSLLEQILVAGQYEKNVKTKPDSREAVEFAIRFPGAKDKPESQVWLPIDSKFPQEDYLRILDAAEKADADALQKAINELSRNIKASAKSIREKYVYPPSTTDVAIMFLATEGLYAEVLRIPSLLDDIYRDYRIIVAGPTTLAAILSSFRMGFQTLAIEQSATKVWEILSAVKTEFSKFGNVLDKVQKQLSTVSNTLDETKVRTRAMEKKLRSVEELPEVRAEEVLALPEIFEEEPDEIIPKSEDKEDLPF